MPSGTPDMFVTNIPGNVYSGSLRRVGSKKLNVCSSGTYTSVAV